MIGDAIPGGGGDVSYGGETGGNVFGLQYYRDKATEFQAILNAVDTAAQAAIDAIPVIADSDPFTADDLSAMLDEFDARKTVMKATAEAINLGAAAINASGGRFPSLSIPNGLGLVPLVLPATTIAAIGVAAALIVWGSQWVSGINERLKLAQLTEGLTPEKRAELADIVIRSDAAQQTTLGSGLSSIANMVKWGAIGFAVFLAYKAFNGTRRG